MTSLIDLDAVFDHTNPAARRGFYLRILSAYRLIQREFPAGFDGFLITLAVGSSDIEGKTLDISSIADLLLLSRQTVSRRLEFAEELGWVKRKYEGKRVLVAATPKAREEVPKLMSKIMAYEKQECEAVGKILEVMPSTDDRL